MYNLPEFHNILRIRNRLLNELTRLNVSPYALRSLDADCVLCGAFIRIDLDGESSFIQLTGEEKKLLTDWQVLRSRARPKDRAFFISLRGKSCGYRMSIAALCAAIEKPVKQISRISNNSLRVIQGGKRE